MTLSHRLTDSERTKLQALGYRPVHAWTRPHDDVFWAEVLAEAEEIAQAEDAADLDLFIEANLQDTFRLINEMEQGGEEV